MSLDEQGRPEPPWAGGERETLIGFLEFQRATLAWKTQGLDGDVLDGDGLTSTLAPSTMTLGGILKHLAWVEDFWFSRRLLGREAAAIWQGVDWTAEPDWEWTSAASDSPGELQRIWSDAVEQSRAITAQALAAEGLDSLEVRGYPDGTRVSLRWILIHMIEEYARHNGHADLLREAVDGQTGE